MLTLVYILFCIQSQSNLLLHGMFGLESLQLLCSRTHDFVRRRNKLLLSDTWSIMQSVVLHVQGNSRLAVKTRLQNSAVVVEAFGILLLQSLLW